MSLPGPDTRLKLKQSPRAAIFRLIDRKLRSNAHIQRSVKTFLSWTGEPKDREPIVVGHAPAIRLTPSSGPDQFWATSGLLGSLTIDVEMAVRGTCWDDLDALWYAVETALYVPLDIVDQNKFIEALQLAGAHKGLCEFSAVVSDPNPGADDLFTGKGVIRLDYRLNFRS